MKLEREFYTGKNTAKIARDLLGKLLVVPAEDGRRVSGMIVETEAYLGAGDRAAHSYGGRRTARVEPMYGLGGHAYVFFVYGMYFQFNVVTGPEEHPHAVLIRGLEPVDGVDIMRERRGVRKDRDLTSGPGKLCIATGIDRSFDGADLTGDRVWLESFRKFRKNDVESGPRVGVDYAGEDALLPLRFWLRGNEYVSRTPNSR